MLDGNDLRKPVCNGPCQVLAYQPMVQQCIVYAKSSLCRNGDFLFDLKHKSAQIYWQRRAIIFPELLQQ